MIQVQMPRGSEMTFAKHLAKKGSIIHTQNKDEICLSRAVVVSILSYKCESKLGRTETTIYRGVLRTGGDPSGLRHDGL